MSLIREYIGIDGKITIDGEDIYLEQGDLKERCKIEDLYGVLLVKPGKYIDGAIKVYVLDSGSAWEIQFGDEDYSTFEELTDFLDNNTELDVIKYTEDDADISLDAETGPQVPESQTPKFCSECGANVEGMKFCSECGKQIINSSQQPPTSEFAYRLTPTESIHCPICRSTDVETMGQDRKAFSIGKAVSGALLAGGIGTIAGFAGKKGEYEMHCKDCGYRWKQK